MKLYIPTSNLNINTLFSSECISPKSFYDTRNYGLKRFHTNELQPNDDFIFLYNLPIAFKATEKELDEECLFIEIDNETSLLNEKFLEKHEIRIGTQSSEVFIYPKTIYFDLSVNFYFPSQSSVKQNVARTIGFDLVKTIEKYIQNFNILSELKGLDAVQGLTSLSRTVNQRKEEFILIDEKIDFLKGAYYASMLGIIQSGNPELVAISNVFKNVNNIVGSLKTELELNTTRSQHGKTKGKSNNRIDEAATSIHNELKKIKRLYEQSFGPEKQLDVLKAGLEFNAEEFDQLINILNHPLVKNLEKQLSKFNLVDIIIQRIQQTNPTLPYLIERYTHYTDNLVKNYLNGWSNDYNDSQLNTVSHLINITLEKKYASKQESTNIISKRFDFDGRSFHCFDVELSIKTQYEIVFNSLIEMHSTSETKVNDETKCELITYIGKKFKEGSDEREYLKQLYKYFKRTLNTPFDPYQSKNLVLTGFSYFLFSFNNINQLYSTLAKHNFTSPFIPLSFWGAYQGYSSLSRELTNKLYSKQINTDLLNSLCYAIDSVHIERPTNSNMGEESATATEPVLEYQDKRYVNFDSFEAISFLDDKQNREIRNIIINYISQKINFKEKPNEQMVLDDILKSIKSNIKYESKTPTKNILLKIQPLIPITQITSYIENQIDKGSRFNSR